MIITSRICRDAVPGGKKSGMTTLGEVKIV